jgi:hypothetical protein
MMTRFCSKKIYEQTGTKATEIHSHHCLYGDTTFPQLDDLIKHSREKKKQSDDSCHLYSSIVPSIHFVPFNVSNSKRN